MSVDTINKRLREMRAAGKVKDIKAKGAAGEAAAFDIVHEYRTKRGGILRQGFMYGGPLRATFQLRGPITIYRGGT